MKNLVIGENYTSPEGEKKVKWSTIGVMIEQEGKTPFIKLHMFPGLIINIFEQKERTEKPPF